MRAWSRILVVAGVLLALLPSAAAAQSAGDEQYEDPFANQPPQQSPAAPPASSTPSQAPAAAPAPAPASQGAPAAAAPAPAPALASRGALAELPRTGAATWLLGLAGLALLAAGLALRAHARRAS